MKTITTLCLIALFAALAPTLSAQTADEIVERILAASGGRQALVKVKSRHVTGTVAVSTPRGDLPGTIEMWNEVPNKSRNVMKVDLSSAGLASAVVDQRFNGEAGYVVDSLQGNRAITGSPLDLMKGGFFPTPFIDYKNRGGTVSLAGREKLADHDAYILAHVPKIGTPTRWYIDAKSYLPIRSIAKVHVPQLGTDVEQTTEYSDYRQVDGLQVPFKIKYASPLQTYVVTVMKIEHNVAMDEASFSKPAGAK